MALAVCALAGVPARAAGVRIGVFGRPEERRPGETGFPKWRGALERYFDEERLAREDPASIGFGRKELVAWKSFLDSLRRHPRKAQIEAVNREMNRRAYVLDPINWRVPDYWASPGQFLHKNGDCEDYAIAKYLSLRSLGFAPEGLRIVVVQDLNLRALHAVASVDFFGDFLILDNQIDSVISHERIHHYKPIYSVNELGWWIHR